MKSEKAAQLLELWAGVECTVNRVGHRYFDQIERSGHSVRIRDLQRLGELGIRTLRYPVLWERVSTAADSYDWNWSDERLAELQRLDITPILGLLHHGSGPPHTTLLDPEFPKKFSTYALAVARRYPWIDYYTPINEPLTTARFSCLYGHWYPHLCDPLVFVQTLLRECKAIVQAMQQIRTVNPAAKLIQTEDLGKTFSTRTLAYQADFENERRWLTFDLLRGEVRPGTPMWDYFIWLGIPQMELEFFLDHTCPPDLIGVNYYITSERFLDERLTRYPIHSHGGNGRHAYADIEAVRVCSEGLSGPKSIMMEVWDRYQSPFAITETHLGCSREEQLRWFKEVWDTAQALKTDGVDVRAVTAWSAFGAFDWNSLLTSDAGCYESGLFDLRSPQPRPTALAEMSRALASGNGYDHPVLDSQGWWHRLDRFSYPPVTHPTTLVSSSVQGITAKGLTSRPLLITGGAGTLGSAFARICEKRGIAYRLLTRHDLDITDAVAVATTIKAFEPWAVVNAAGYVRVDEAEEDIERCQQANVTGPENLAYECARQNLKFVTFSSDLVFDGRKQSAYVESDPTAPLNVYGQSKATAEQRVLKFPGSLIIRTSAFFGPWDEFCFTHLVLRTLAAGKIFYAATDQYVSPTYVPDLVNATLDLLIDGETGIWHLANIGSVTWEELALEVAERAGHAASLVQGSSLNALGTVAIRPAYSVLESEKATLMPTLERALDNYFHESRRHIAFANVTSGKR